VLPSEQDRPDVARRRKSWKRYQAKVDPRRLVFIDETWAKTNMTRSHGWSQRGQRLNAKAPYGHWKTLTFLAALRHNRIDAPAVFDGPIIAVSLTAHVEQFLVPTLKSGGIVIVDNLRGHKGEAIRSAIRAAGARLFFPPPYSTDLNPIEQVFAKLKTLHKRAANGPSRRHGGGSARSSTNSRHGNAQTIPGFLAMLQSIAERSNPANADRA
jgi:transposase